MTHRLAINPLPWVLTADGFDVSTETLTPALRQLREAGYSALHADIPVGMSPEKYAAFLASFDFEPAPGYFGGAFDDADQHVAIAENARVHAQNMAALGLSETFIAADMSPLRMALPGVGADPSDERLVTIAEGLVMAADAMHAVGVRAALHPHVGTFIEVEAEVRAVLERTAGSTLGFGPDTGHLTWAGMDAAAIIRDYQDRVVATHLKDVDRAAVTAARASTADYVGATMIHHVWTEPGRGSIDFDAVFDALPAGFAGWSVVEVDVPNLPTPAESATASLHYLRAQPFFAGKE